MKNTTRVIIVDDHDITLHGMGVFINSLDDVELIAQSNSGAKALQILENNDADIVISDLDMPKMDGLELMHIVQDNYPKIKVLICTMHFNSWTLKKLVKNNVDGIISKNNVLTELKTAIEYINRGEKYFSPEVNKIINTTFNKIKPESKYFRVHLTKREKEILNYIAQEKTTASIADLLSISINTVETHRKNLFVKLNVTNAVGLIKTAIERDMI